MASSAEIGALRVSLSMNAGEFKKGSKDAGSSLDALAVRFGITAAVISKAADAVGMAIERFVDATIGGVNRAIDAMGKLSKEARNTGESAEQLSRLQFAAQATAVSIETLSSASATLGKHLTEVAGGETESEAARALAAVGISATTSSGEVRAFGDVLLDLSAKFATYRDGTAKVALANQIFGSSGAELIPLLNRGSEGIAQLTAEADRLGVTVSTSTARAAELLSQEVSKLNASGGALYNRIAAELIPSMRWLTGEMQSFNNAGSQSSMTAQAISWAFKAVLDVGQDVVTTFKVISELITSMSRVAAAALGGEFAKAVDIMGYSLNRVKDINDQANAAKERLWNPNTWTTATQIVPAAMAPVIDSLDKTREAARLLKEQGALLFDEVMASKTDTMAQKLLQLEALYKQGMITQLQYQKGQRKVAEVGEQSMDALLSTTSQTLTAIFAKNKGAAIASALINTYQGITKALASYPPPYSFAMAAMQGAMGFAQVRAISQQSENGTGGGGGGAAATAAPAVPAGGGDDGGAGGVSQTLFVQGITSGQMFSSDAVRDLASRLLDFQRDGGKVVLQ